MKTKPPAHEITLRLRPLYNEPALIDQLEFFRQDAAENYSGYRTNPDNERSNTLEIITGTSHCIFARVTRDYAPVSARPTSQLSEQWVALLPLDQSRDPAHINPTGWSYIYDGFETNHRAPNNPCDASS
ncbi:MAG: hypothetical protein M3011_07610 [Actinomycetota bacterium]|nr:hypothetical protein [Actinomycetota bacterium]